MYPARFVCRRITPESLEAVRELFLSVFEQEPWNDDWSDDVQLRLYLNDLTGQSNSLTYGLYEGEKLIGVSMGQIKHWYSGTEYYINEFCIRSDHQGQGAGTFFLEQIDKDLRTLGIEHIFLLTEKHVPAYHFYRKNGFQELRENTAFFRKVGK